VERKATPPDRLNEREKEILARLSGGSSDRQIADELFLSLNTVKWYNRQISSNLGVSSRTQAIAHARTFSLLDAGVSVPQPVSRHNLPAQSTPFIGRGREISEVKHLLGRSRQLTLTGTGGTGKTRLALQVAAEVGDAIADGVCLVDLAPTLSWCPRPSPRRSACSKILRNLCGRL
jgi:DNA-binding CsgD family transcriptional regulator